MIGQTLSHYSIVEKIGEGGMGVVYRAKDQKLGRDVAIKVLPEEFARDHDRVARFQREAKLLASLNHPNIATIHGLEELDGAGFLVLELVEGETLADRLKRGPIPVEEAMKLAFQIAEALEAAHGRSVIHRDLKPANIKVTPDGKVKVLDFGLAKAFAAEQSDLNLSDSPTLSQTATMQGVILGTAAYMSPEQAKGKPVDRRTDIWAFGTVLFEMLACKPAFEGDEVSEILASVIKGDSNLDLLPENIHPRVREVLTRCLQKDLRKRYADINDARYEIEIVLSDPRGVFFQPETASELHTRPHSIIPWIVAVIGILIVGIAVWFFRPTDSKNVIRFDYELPESQQFTRNPVGVIRYILAISPDGNQFVYCTPEGLYLRSMKDLKPRLLDATEGRPSSPVFSPDGQWIGYFTQADNKLKKIAVSGGSPVVICDTGSVVTGASWNSDNTIVFGDPAGGGIKRVSANGGEPVVLVESNMSEATGVAFPVFPQILPGGKNLLFTNVKLAKATDSEVIVHSLKSGHRRVLLKGGSSAKYLPTGHIVYISTHDDITNLRAIPFDSDSLEITGGAVPLVEDVLVTSADFSDTGTLVYIPVKSSYAGSTATLMWVDRDGNEEPLPVDHDIYRSPKISPDGTKVALTINKDRNEDIYVWDIPTGAWTQLTSHESIDDDPLWVSDGKRIVFSSSRGGIMGGIYWTPANSTGGVEKLSQASSSISFLSPSSLSIDGKTLLLQEAILGGISGIDFNIGTLSLEGDHEHETLLDENYDENNPKISPDGKWMAYSSNEFSEMISEVYVRPFPDVDKGKWPVSQGGGAAPLWSPDGRELFYLTEDSIMVVQVETEQTLNFKFKKAKVLFTGNFVPPSSDDNSPWDINPNDKRFLMKNPTPIAEERSSTPSPEKIIVVTNWFEELKEKVPTD